MIPQAKNPSAAAESKTAGAEQHAYTRMVATNRAMLSLGERIRSICGEWPKSGQDLDDLVKACVELTMLVKAYKAEQNDDPRQMRLLHML